MGDLEKVDFGSTSGDTFEPKETAISTDITSSTDDGFLVVDSRNLVVAASPNIGNLLGDILVGESSLAQALGSADEPVGRCDSPLELDEREISTRSQDGVLSRVRLRVAETPGLAGSNHYVVNIRRCEGSGDSLQEVFRQNRLETLGRLLSGVVHEINNTMSTIVGYSQLLLLKDPPRHMKTDLERVHQEAMRTTQIIDRVLSFSRRKDPELGPIDAVAAVTEALELQSHRLRVHRVRVDNRIGDDLPTVVGDDVLLRQVFANLIANAERSISESSKGGVITLRAHATAHHVFVYVRDDGPGIEPGELDRIFEPFYSTRKNGEGNGLGLAISRHILEEFEGSLSVDRSFHAGASFLVRLKRAPQQTDPTPRKSIQGKTILIVTDDPGRAESADRAVCRAKGRAVFAGSADAALDRVREGDIDLVLVTMTRSNLEGSTFQRRLHQSATGRPPTVLFVPPDSEDSDAKPRTFLDCESPFRLEAPFSDAALIERMAELLDRRDDEDEPPRKLVLSA